MAKTIFAVSDIKKLNHEFLNFTSFLETVIQLFNCCVDMYSKGQYAHVVEWINLVLYLAELVVDPPKDSEKSQVNTLLKNATRLLIRALCVEDPHKALTVVKDMEIKFPNSTEMYLSKFEVLDTQKTSSEVYEENLMEFVLSANVTLDIESLLFIINHLDSKCNVLPSLDYVIANKLSFDEEREIAFQVLLLRIQLTLEKSTSQPIDLIEFFICMYCVNDFIFLG